MPIVIRHLNWLSRIWRPRLLDSSQKHLALSTIEAGLVGSLTSADSLAEVQRAGLSAEDFIVYGDVFRFLSTYLQQYQALPSRDQILARFPEWNPPQGDFRFWLDEKCRFTLAYRAQIAIKDALTAIEERPETAIRELSVRLGDISLHTAGHIEATDATIGTRLERYQYRVEEFQRQKGQHIWGIPTGLRIIDETHQGWMPGELVGFYARPTVGKTWMLIRAGAIAWMYPSNRILFISPEMPANQIALRIDALLAGQLVYPFSHSKVYSGDPTMADKYQQLAGVVQQHERWFTVDSVGNRMPTVSDISALHKQLRPNLILIDGVSLLRDEQNAKSSWEQMRNICYGLKAFATTAQVAIIVSHQTVNTRRGHRGEMDVAQGRGDDWIMPSLNDAAFGDSFVQACSTIFTMCPDRDDPRIRWYSIRKTRERDIVFQPRLALAWNVDCGKIIDLGHLRQDMEAIRQQLEVLAS